MAWKFKTEEDAYRHTEDRTIVNEKTLYEKDDSGNYVESSVETHETTIKKLRERYEEGLLKIAPAIRQSDEIVDKIADIKSDLDLDIEVPDKMSEKLTAEQKALLGMEE